MTRKRYLADSGHISQAVWSLVFLAFACLFLTIPVPAQVFDTGTVSRLVTDPSGAVVPHADVTITNVGTGVERKRPQVHPGD